MRLSLFNSVLLAVLTSGCMLFGSNALGQATTKIVNEPSGDTSLFLEVRGVEDASVDAIPVERTSPNGKELFCAYDINISKDGHEWQPEPEQPAIVSMEAPNFADGQLLDIYHEGANGLEFVATVAPENGKITFPAHSFSVYIVVAAGDYARLKVKLHQADGTIVTIYVKKLDILRGDDFKRIVYNPGFGTIAESVQCMGWIAKEAYTEDDIPSAMTFDEVRSNIYDLLDAGVEDGTELDMYAMLFKSFSVLYLDENEAVINNDVMLFRADKNVTSLSYTVNTNYTPRSGTSKFEGWRVYSPTDGSHIVGHTDDSRIYALNTTIDITGNVTFNVVVSEGFWLIYHENGKGATYKAADFVHAGEGTEEPTLTMLRNGYTFVGWYNGEPATQYGDPTGGEFVFGNPLEDNTHVYAKWRVNETANYTVIIWKQNVECTGYDFEEAILLEGPTNTEVNTVRPDGTGNARHANIYGEPKEYTGFSLSSFNEHVNIAPEGNSIVNVYYDRIEYTVKFIYYSIKGSNYYYASDGTGSRMSSLWSKCGSGSNEHPTCNYSGLSSTTIDGYTYYYYPITAKYGQSIRDVWPQYSYFPDFRYSNRDYKLASWILMEAARPDPDTRSVKGVVVTMDENILGDMTSSDGNYLVARYGTSINNWTYNIWLPKVAGENYSGMTSRNYGGVDYYLDEAITAKSGNQIHKKQPRPSLPGYSEGPTDTTQSLVMDFYYIRNEYAIIYMDGSYYNGNNVRLTDYSPSGQLRQVSGISFGTNMSSYGDYVHSAPRGFVFEGWYVDEPCTQPFDFDTKMPSANVTVYAKWRQIQYRVFLHPNVSADDESIFWGSDNQAMNFRIDYGHKISVPTGTRDDYEFVSWYSDAAFTHPFNENTIVLNDDNTVPYNKTTDFTDPMDKWGNGATWNAELYYEDEDTHEILPRNPERFWITRKYDLYGKWRAKLRGANGITIIYEDNDGVGPVPTEELLYQDNVKVIAGPACSYRDDSKVFSHWVLQHYNGESYEDIPNSRIYPGTAFIAYKEDSKMVVTRWFDPDHPDDYIIEGFDPTSTAIHPLRPDDPYTDYLATYTIKLRAEYVDVETPEYTFIEWFMNDGEGTLARTDGTSGIAPSLIINEAVDIPTPTREGYIFRGWYKENVSLGDPIPTTISSCTPNFLYYSSNKYYKESTYTNEVSQVAADRYMTYDYLYAIWEPEVQFDIEPVCMGVPVTLPTTTNAGVDLSAGTWSWTASSGTISGTTTYTASESANVTLTFNPDPSTCAQAKDFNVSFLTPNVDSPSLYDYIWKSGTESDLADWNTASNWYVYDGGYSVARELPTSESNVYIGPSQCVMPTWPSQTGDAKANNITIDSDAKLIVPADRTLMIAGSLDNIGILEATDGNVEFCGTSGLDQTISHDVTFGNVTFSSKGNIVPSGSVLINGNAKFAKGILVGDVTFKEGASVDVSTYNSFVSGTVTKLVGERAEIDFTFPTGSKGVDQPKVLGSVKVAKLPINSTTSVTFHQKSNGGGFGLDVLPRWWNVADNCSGNNPQFDHVSNYEYWNVNTSSTLDGAVLTVSAADVNAHFGSPSNYDPENIFGAMWMGSCWQNLGGPARVAGSTITISVDSIPAVSHRNPEPSFLTLGSKDHSTLLPIELLSFTATCEGGNPLVEWATATERNNDYFVIERSDDAINFNEVARVAGAGNSIDKLDYSYVDYNAASGDNYYRLVQVDYDGSRSVSDIVVVVCNGNADGNPDVMAYPNPFNEELTLVLGNFGNRPAHIEVYDMLGRLVMQDKVDAPQNSYEMTLHFGNLPLASYTIRISTADFVINKQVVKN